jgi:uncharacterized cupin superfamily protein
MTAKPQLESLVRVADRPDEIRMAHPLNPRSEMHGLSLSDQTGMSRVGVNLIRLPPGRESCILHSHSAEEEFVYILSGQGVAEIGDREHEVGPGDFMGFPTPSVAHHLRNESDEDLVYLVGGERKQLEIAEFPTLGKTVFRVGGEAKMVDSDQVETFWKPEE